jgi:hypothetical protein
MNKMLFLLPGTDQLLPTSSSNANIGVVKSTVGHVRSTHTAGEGKDDQNGVGTSIRQPDVVFELRPVLGHVLVKVSTRFNSHGTGGDGCPVRICCCLG